MAETKILTCKNNCNPSPFQDAKYGKGKRVMNKCLTQQGQPPLWRCTVCGRETREG